MQNTGLACSLLNIESVEQLSQHYLRGGLFESCVVSELVKQRFNQGKDSNCYFWRDNKGHEVDCILEQGGKVIPIEIKSGETLGSDFFSHLTYWRTLANVEPEYAYLIYGGDENQMRREGNVLSWSSTTEIY